MARKELKPKTKPAKKPKIKPRPRRPLTKERPRQSAAIRTKKPDAPKPTKPLITKAGIYPNIPFAAYHADPLPAPSLSSSLLVACDQATPAHARLLHPRLNSNFREREPSREMHFGTAAHAYLMDTAELQVIKATNWRTDYARSTRDRASAAGMPSVLMTEYQRLVAMKKKLRAELPKTRLGDVFEAKGMNEVVAAWQEDGVWNRARADRWLPPGSMKQWPNGLILDFKFTFDSASSEAWPNTAFRIGSDFQSVYYPHGFALAINQSGGTALKVPAFAFVVQEVDEPFEFQVYQPDEIMIEHTTSKIVRAFAAMKDAIKTGAFPGYPRETAFLTPPQWEVKREERAALAAVVLQRPL